MQYENAPLYELIEASDEYIRDVLKWRNTPKVRDTMIQRDEILWEDHGQFYWGSCEAWLEGGAIFSNMSSPVIIPRYRVQDIDTQEDWQQAEYLWKVSNAQ